MSVQEKVEIKKGHGRPDRPITKELLEKDSKPDHIIITEQPDAIPSYRQIDYKRYYDQDYADQEVEHVWRKQWLYAAREEDFANVGDRIPLNIGPLSFIIIRHEKNGYKAFYNSCLHRGSMLCTEHDNVATIKCPYHGWEWNLDGSLNRIPGHWDFPDVTKLNGHLREVKLDRWGGCIFINCDPDCGPLSEWLGILPEHAKCVELENRYTAAHFKKLMRANWKANLEAFQESYHLTTTHPEAVPFNTDQQAQYEIWRTPQGGLGRSITPGCVPSMFAEEDANMVTATYAFMEIMKSWHYPDAEIAELDPEGDVRKQAADWHRKVFKEKNGRESEAPDTVLLDSLLYFVFPNFTVWVTEAVPILYRFLPHETDPEMSYFEVRVLRPIPAGQEAPPPAPCRHMGADDSMLDVAEGFNFLAMVFSQDTGNMPLIQRGMHAADPGRGHSTLGRYQEQIVQFWHQLFDEKIPQK
jgi:phenylpropionate dioxygenase-like ring-hydroxylating dioxygenase large terminal subunit